MISEKTMLSFLYYISIFSKQHSEVKCHPVSLYLRDVRHIHGKYLQNSMTHTKPLETDITTEEIHVSFQIAY